MIAQRSAITPVILALVIGAGVCGGAPAAIAHDFWLQPDLAWAKSGARIPLRLFVGDAMKTEGGEQPFDRPRAVSFILHRASGELDLMDYTRHLAKPTTVLRARRAGGQLVSLDRGRVWIELGAAKFNRYLKREIPSAWAERKKRGELEKPGREVYTRNLKALLNVGDVADDTYKKILGQDLEIIPTTDPSRVPAGGRLKVLIHFEGKPLRGAPVQALRKGGPPVSATTDASGHASLELSVAGAWMVRLVHMTRCDGCKRADWRSWWASYWFSNKAP